MYAHPKRHLNMPPFLGWRLYRIKHQDRVGRDSFRKSTKLIHVYARNAAMI
jgi:hypothetical protein